MSSQVTVIILKDKFFVESIEPVEAWIDSIHDEGNSAAPALLKQCAPEIIFTNNNEREKYHVMRVEKENSPSEKAAYSDHWPQKAKYDWSP